MDSICTHTITWGKKKFEVRARNVIELKNELCLLTGVAFERVKLTQGGKIWSEGELSEPMMFNMIGSTADLPPLPPETEDKPRQKPYAHKRVYREEQPHPQYRFHAIETLPGYSDAHVARGILEDLANDPGILAVLKKHKWSVGSLAELEADGKVGVDPVCVLGLNKNRGQQILLRLRTDDHKGFRKRLAIRKVLYHELSHNEFGEHDDNFYMLMRQVEREATELDWRKGKSRQLAPGIASGNGGGPVFAADDNDGPSATGHVLGTSEDADQNWDPESTPAENARIAALLRFSEADTCMNCGGTTRPQSQPAPLGEEQPSETDPDPSRPPLMAQEEPMEEPKHEQEQEKVPQKETISSPLPLSLPSLPPLLLVGEEIYEDVVTALDESIAVAMSLSSGTEDRLGKMREALARFLQARLVGSIPSGIVSESLDTIETVKKIVNKARTSSEPKYKSVKSTSSRFMRIIGQREGGVDILQAAGFEEQIDSFTLRRDDPGLLYMMEGLLGTAQCGLLKHYDTTREAHVAT